MVTIDTNQLKSERSKLFQQCVKVDSFQELLEVQMAIANSILRAERLLKGLISWPGETIIPQGVPNPRY